MKNPPPTQNPRAGVSIAAIAATPYPSRVEKELLFLTPDDKSRGHSVHPRAVSFSQGWGFRTLPLPRGAGGTPLAGSGRRPGEGRPGPGRLALIRRFAAPSPSGRRDKPPDRGKMKRPWKTWYPGSAWFAGRKIGGTGRHAGLDIELN